MFYLQNTPQAVETIHAIRASSDTLKEQEATIRKGLNIFKIDQAPNKDIVALDLALEHLEAIWEINRWGEKYTRDILVLYLNSSHDYEET